MKAVSGLKIALNAIPIRGRLPMVARQAPSFHGHAGACRLIRLALLVYPDKPTHERQTF